MQSQTEYLSCYRFYGIQRPANVVSNWVFNINRFKSTVTVDRTDGVLTNQKCHKSLKAVKNGTSGNVLVSANVRGKWI
ncbi:MAG: hypothetical protein U9N07_06390 [Euryarchaeota archaeon]|nr:hypothetical protein [Euryarchaeota archaeon]